MAKSKSKNSQSVFKWLIKVLASIKMAVFIILAVAALSAVGTIYEARYDAQYAQKMVYHSPYMYFVLTLLCLTLTAVMVDRWPWKKRHAGFVFAHIGIIILLVGAWVTQRFGLDGSISFGIGEKNRYVIVPDTELSIYSSYDGSQWRRLYHQPVDFLLDPPPSDGSLEFALSDGDKISVSGYQHYAVRQEKIGPSDLPTDGPGVRFQLQNDRVNLSEWLLKPSNRPKEEMNLGPARVVLVEGKYQPSGGNEIVLTPQDDKSLKYEIFSQRKNQPIKRGVAQAGDTIETGWMGLQFRVLQYLPKASRKVDFIPRETPTPLTTSAVEVNFNGTTQWVGLNSPLRLFGKSQAYVFSYGNTRIPLDFELTLKQFNVGRYQGTMRAASYESIVEVPGQGEVVISMNNPLKYKGYTFYQASFEEDENGQPVVSILSVNRDPGRWIKYLGSLLIVLGTAILFWFKRLDVLQKRKSQAEKENYDKMVTTA